MERALPRGAAQGQELARRKLLDHGCYGGSSETLGKRVSLRPQEPRIRVHFSCSLSSPSHQHASRGAFVRGSDASCTRQPLKPTFSACDARRPASADTGIPAAADSNASSLTSGPVAFFDVDGTILNSNVVTAFLTLKLARMSFAEKTLWLPYFFINILIYLVLDRIDRALFNRMFYRNYRGVSVTEKDSMARELHQQYVLPRILPEAQAHIQNLRSQGFRIVLVTGSLDFLMQPLAQLLHCDAVYAARLKEKHGRFSGELEGEAVSASEKAQLVRQYAEEHGVDLQACHAYGDSVADLAMLETVGFPHAVRPETRLRKIAEQRGWPVLDWAAPPKASGNVAISATAGTHES